ncbi:hypothetical protein SPSYN_00093 [Sporotomaculum syntrophicum]|uniref:Uncharacterized protein n=1 Tax=Sporotomaculum syntrophicum TaxID=182264 RepID=A0A9D2WSM0_9FIRM|nr:hypothetical protein SPSYN_00093 [Sporotomaculum syntrophicum]
MTLLDQFMNLFLGLRTVINNRIAFYHIFNFLFIIFVLNPSNNMKFDIFVLHR